MNGNFDKEIKEIFLDDIVPNRFQPRLNFDQKSLMELSDSIKQHGIIQPLVLRRLGDKFEIIAGERRFKAAQIAGLNKVPAIIMDLDDNKSAEVAIVENLQRKEMSAFEEAKSFKKLLERGITQEQLGIRLGKSQPYIANKLRLLSLDEKVQEALIKEQISERHARSLLSIKEPLEQQKTLDEIVNRKLTVKETDDMIKERFGGETIMEETNQIHELNNSPITPQTNIMDFNLEDIPIEKKEVQNNINNQEVIHEVSQSVPLQPVIQTIQEIPNDSTSLEVPQPINEQIFEIPKEDLVTQTEQPNDTPTPFETNSNFISPVIPLQEVNTPKPFVLVDEESTNSENSLNYKPEPHSNVDNNPQMNLINRLSSIENNSESISFKEAGGIKPSPYVIPRRDIEDTYLTPNSNVDVNNLKNNAKNINEEPLRSFDINKLLNSDPKPEVELKPETNQPMENSQPQNRFIVDLETIKPVEKEDDIAKAKSILKTTVQSVKDSGVKIDFEEFDFERLYQIIIKIEK